MPYKRDCLLIGASGFIGRNLTRFLLDKGVSLISLARSQTRLLPEMPNHTMAVGDPRDSGFLVKVLAGSGCQHVIHCAGKINGTRQELLSANLKTTKAIVQALESLDLSAIRLIYISSVSAIEGWGEYGEIKREAEEVIQGSKLRNWIILRPSLVYGPEDDKNVAALMEWIRFSPIVPIPGGKRTKLQPLYVDDLAEIVSKAIQEPNVEGRTLTLAGPEQIPLFEMARIIACALDRKRWLLPIPLLPIQIGARVIQLLMPIHNLPIQQILTLHNHPPFDSSPAREVFGFSPRPFSKGILEFVERQGKQEEVLVH